MPKIKREVMGVPVTPNRNLLYYDDVDGRKWLLGALGRLDDRQRLAYVNWCCRHQGRFDVIRAEATLSYRGTVYYSAGDAAADLASLTILGGQGGVDADLALRELERRVRKA